MFSPPKRTENGSAEYGGRQATTIIARGVRVEGDFTSQGDVTIEGEVHGHVVTSGVLTVGSDAKLKADISAAEASVAGAIEGNVTVKQHLELKSSAQILGDITCETVSIEAGATLHGMTHIGASTKKEASAEPRERGSVKSSAA